MTILRDLSVLWSLFHILILFMLLYRTKYSKRKTVILTGIAMGPLILLNVAGLILYGPSVMGRAFPLTCTLPSLLFFWFISKDKRGRFFFTFCLADTVALWIIAVTNVLDFYLGGQRYVLMLAGRLVLFPLAEWFAVRRMRGPYLELQESVPDGWGIFAWLTGGYYLLLTVMANFPAAVTERPMEVPAFLLVLLLMPMTYAAIFTALYHQLQLHRRKQGERMLLEQKLQLETRLEDQQQIRRIKHDMKTHTVILSGLLNAGETEKALDYLNRIRSETEAAHGSFCANPCLNIIFSHYAGKIHGMKAELKLDIQMGDEYLPAGQLCLILSNGLENACEALEKVASEKRRVSVQMKYSKAYLLIRIRNTLPQGLSVERGIFPKSGKKEPGHGFGLVSIAEAAKQLGGEAWCYTEEETFILDVMVKRKQPEKGEKGSAKMGYERQTFSLYSDEEKAGPGGSLP